MINRLMILAAASVALVPAAADAPVISRMAAESVSQVQMLSTMWQSPVAMEQRGDSSLSAVGGEYALRRESEPLDARLGDREQTFSFVAQTYLHHGRSTLWGGARYDNATVKGMRWNETSDIDVVSPYLLGDSVPTGTMYGERYAFMGGFASHSGRWHYGGTISYRAGHYYRRVDPRPRNVTADLDLAAGAGIELGRQLVSLAVGFKRYKQTNDVAFYSEMGVDKVFHLTGLANDYGRFAGTGHSTYYRGGRWHAVATLSPLDKRGLWTAVRLSRMSIGNVITPLNKLPLARVTLNEAVGEAAWLQPRWGVRLSGGLSRRVGRENVFGDAASSVYPVIGELPLYRENQVHVNLSGMWCATKGAYTVAVRPHAGYDHVNVVYLDPQCRQLVNRVIAGMGVTATHRGANHFTMLAAAYDHTAPTSDVLMLTGVRDELSSLARQVESRHDLAAHRCGVISVEAGYTRALSARFALSLAACYSHGFYHKDVSADGVRASLRLVF